MQILVEIAAASVEDVIAAKLGGAARVELSSALSLGGLTPSLGTLTEAKRRVNIPVFPMLRPRPAGFCYSRAEFDTMLRDAELSLQHGADGLVFGILNANGTIDVERCAKLMASCKGTPFVFHRAFDVTPDPLRALDELIDLGFTRVLTSGQQPTALEGAELIRTLIDHANGRIEILPGSGIRRDNVAALVTKTGCTQVHLSARAAKCDTSTSARPQIVFANGASVEGQYDCADETVVRAVVEAVQVRNAIAETQGSGALSHLD